MSHEKFTQAQLEQKAAQIMESFDFEVVHRHMLETDWKWYSNGELRTPDIEEIKITARRLLTNVIWNESVVSNSGTGGFMAYKMPWGLELTFQLANRHA